VGALPDASRRFQENLIEVPLKEFPVRSFAGAVRYGDEFTCPRVKLLTVPEFLTKPRADEKSMLRIHAKVSTVVEDVNVRS
jgi:hypothetical protein